MMMGRDQLAALVGESLTKQLRTGLFWSRDGNGQPGVRVKQLADAVAEDLQRDGIGAQATCAAPCCAEGLAAG